MCSISYLKCIEKGAKIQAEKPPLSEMPSLQFSATGMVDNGASWHDQIDSGQLLDRKGLSNTTPAPPLVLYCGRAR